MSKKGFVCPNCKTPLVVVKTRPRAAGIVARRRKCETCPYKLTTEERPKAAITGPVHK